MKILIALLFVFLGVNNLVFAQLFNSAYPLSTISADISTISLANSTVAVTGDLADYHINPAGIGIDNTLEITRRNKAFGLDGNLLYQEITGKIGRYAFAVSFRNINTGEIHLMGYRNPPYIHRPAAEDIMFNSSFAYSFVNGLSLGVGVNHGKLEDVLYVDQHEYKKEDVKKTSFNFGLLYKREVFENDKLLIEPSVGLSLNDYGKGIHFYRSNYKNPLPMTARIGSAVKIQTKETMFNQPLMEFNVMGGLSKIMSRTELKQDGEGNYYRRPMPPGKALTDSWDPMYQHNYNTGRMDTSKAWQQIWKQVGVEMKLLGTLSFRLGIENAAMFEDFLDKIAYGIGLDFYFLQFQYVHSFYVNGYDADLYSFEGGKHFQIIFRFPLANNTQKGIFNQFIKRSK
ncbi:MAG: hypothetical protein WD022_04105 [Balneolaceae bacterium]